MPNIGTTIGVYPANNTAGDEVSSTFEGRHLTFLGSELATPASSGVVSKGDPVVLRAGHGDIVGVAFNDATATDLVAIDTEGIWQLKVYGQDDWGAVAVVAGDAIYIDFADGSCRLDRIQDPESHCLFGYALGGVTSNEWGIISVKVHWGVHENRILKGILTNYTEATSARPRVKINSDYSGVAGIHRVIHVTTQMTDDSGTNESSLYGARFQAVLPDSCTLTTVGHLTGVHGYIQFLAGSICSDGAAGPTGAPGGIHSGVRGEVYAPAGVTFTGVRFINAVMGTANLRSEVLAGHYSAIMAYAAISDATMRPDSAYYMWGYFNAGIDFTGWANAHGNTFAFAEDYGAEATVQANAVCGRIRITIDGNPFFIPVWN